MSPEDWRPTQLRREIELIYGKGLPASARVAGEIPVYGSNGIVGCHNKSLVKGPGIIVGRKGSVGEVVFSEGPFWPIDTTYYVSNQGDNNWRFLYFLLQHLRLTELNSHSTVPGLNRESVYSIESAFPPKSEQEKIAAMLWKIQKAVEIEDAIVRNARELKKSLVRRLFTHGLRGEPLKETEIGPIPESWEAVPLAQVCISSAFGPRFSGALYSTNGAVLTLRTTDLDDDGRINFSRVPAADLNPREWSDHLLQPGDCVVSRSGTCGIVAVFTGYKKPVLPGAFLIRVRLNGTILPEFFRDFGNSPNGRAQMEHLAQGAVQKNISGTRLLTFQLPLPSPDEQREIADILQNVDRKIDIHEFKKRSLQDLFKTMVHKLMTAQIRVNNLDINTSGLQEAERGK